MLATLVLGALAVCAIDSATSQRDGHLTPAPMTAPDPSPEVGPALSKLLDRPSAKLLAAVVAEPSRLDLRRELVSSYSGNSQDVYVSALITLSVRFLEGGDLSLGRRASRTVGPVLPCNTYRLPPKEAEELDHRVAAEARRIGEVLANDQELTGKGLAAAEGALASLGPYCPLLAEWASAYLRTVSFHPDRCDDLLWELAFREAITLAEANVLPWGVEGVAPVYLMVGDSFAIRHDYVTAYAAYLLADKSCRTGSGTGPIEPEHFRELVTERLKGYKALAEAQR